MQRTDPTPAPIPIEPVTLRSVLRTWWPLAASWILMGCELPLVSAVLARLPDPKVHLAAYGGVVFPLALLIESPIIMLLSASTALSRDWASYRVVRRYMWWAGSALTLAHALVAFTPAWRVVVIGVLHAPAAVQEPAHLGLRLMLPWTLSIAYRRTQQGLMIRGGHSHSVGIGTGVRLATEVLVLWAGFTLHRLPGIAVGAMAVASGVVSEAIYAGFAVRSVKRALRHAPAAAGPVLTLRSFLHFYIPLVLSPLLLFFSGTMVSGAMGRMPDALASLAVWPVVTGLVFTLRSVGFAYHEVVVSFLERPQAAAALRRFALMLAACTTSLLAIMAVTPLSRMWFSRVAALPPDLVTLAVSALWLCAPLPALSVFQSYYQGALVHGRRTRDTTESVAAYVLVAGAVLAAGVLWNHHSGIYAAVLSFVLGGVSQFLWLRRRGRVVFRDIAARHRESVAATAARPGAQLGAAS